MKAIFKLLHRVVNNRLHLGPTGICGERSNSYTKEEKKKGESQHGLHDWRRREDVKRESLPNGFGCGRRG